MNSDQLAELLEDEGELVEEERCMSPKAYGKLTKALRRNPGGLHRALRIPAGKKIPASELARARNSKNKHVRQMANLANTARHFKH